ncbi:MAG: D-alanine--D-alanine ligase [Candidatus Doudnabacteria bacterium]|nr:D-alanine--D-alanine ligase [Candidatus Doudnabacteria bacterium]
MTKIRVGIIFGGRSAEHEVSLQSAKNIIEALDKNKYEPVLIGIDKHGGWHLQDNADFLLNSSDPRLIALNKSNQDLAVTPGQENRLMVVSSKADANIDVVFPVLHGTYGEDGTMQGLLKLLDIPFVGPSVLGSAVAMDKDVAKRLMRDGGIPIAEFSVYRKEDNINFSAVIRTLGLPLFVKPANLGSSVGISKAKNEDELKRAVDVAFQFDNKILIEESVEGREIECAVLGNENPMASIPGEVIPHHEFYSYEAKYIDENGAALEIPAKLGEQEVKLIQELAIRTFKTLELEGMSRVDFFLKPNGEALVNEVNTIPGFTKISMFPKLWEASGISYSDLIDRLIQLAIERHKNEQALKTSA